MILAFWLIVVVLGSLAFLVLWGLAEVALHFERKQPWPPR